MTKQEAIERLEAARARHGDLSYAKATVYLTDIVCEALPEGNRFRRAGLVAVGAMPSGGVAGAWEDPIARARLWEEITRD